MKKVLVVEDDLYIRRLYMLLLEKVGLTMVIPAEFTLAAIEAALAANPETICAICDGNLGDGAPINGADVVRCIRSLGAATTVLAITSDDILAREMILAGADKHLFKPFLVPEVQRILVDI